MSLITRCPSCQTLFKLVPDQLRISEGWVRCGQCAEAFDASLHLVPSPPATAAAATPKNRDAVPVEQSPAAESLRLALPEEPPVAPPEGILSAPAEIEIEIQERQEKQEEKLETEGARPVPEVAQEEAAALPPPLQPPAVVPATSDDAPREVGPDSDEVSFLRQAKVPAAPAGGFVRAAWVFLSGVLLLGLLGQIAVQERDRIAAVQPDHKPWLQALCEPLSCSVSPWKHIDSVVIDSSAFTRLRGDVYRLSFTLKNMAAVPVAVPALELTLTDSLDQPVIRRVLMSSELAMPSQTLDAGLEQSVLVALAVNPKGGADRVAGYRLLAFYP